MENVIEQIQANLNWQNTQSNTNLNWLQQAMHPFFFTFNQNEVEALGILANSIYRLDRFPHVTLVDRPDRLMLTQVSRNNSIYNTLHNLPFRPNLSYTEVNTSLQNLPDYDQPLEVLRFDFARKSDQEVAETRNVAVPAEIMAAVASALKTAAPDYDQSKLQSMMELLWVNNEEYVRVSHPERLARLIQLYEMTRQHDGIFLDIQPMEEYSSSKTGRQMTRVRFGVANPPQHNFLLQIMEVFKRLNIGTERAYILTMSSGIAPWFLGNFYVGPNDGSRLEKGTPLFNSLQHELYNLQILPINSPSYGALLEKGITNGVDTTLVEAMISFCHTNLAHNHPEQFEPEAITLAFHNHLNMTLQLIRLFYTRFQPGLENREADYQQQLAETERMIPEFNTGRRFLDESRRTIFHCAIAFIRYCLKTNFFVDEKHALAFRLDPQYLDYLGEEFTADLPPERPFRITFFFGRGGAGYHIGFSDIARGGWRTLMTQGRDDYINGASTLFRENYVLAHTQHLKNKDIYEGGSKMVAILTTNPAMDKDQVRQQLYKLQFGFINAFLDLYVTENGRARNPRVVDYYGEDEPIELGPDENMHNTMIELIAGLAVKRGYLLGAGIMSSKKVGINHKEYGVTSIGVIRFAEVTMQEVLDIDMHADPFSVKFTGGPNGDVAGNGMRLLLERCPQVRIKLVVDGTGALYDPQGIDHTALKQIVLQNDVEAFDFHALNPGGFMLFRLATRQDGMRELFRKVTRTGQGVEEEWISNDAFYSTFNNLIFTVPTDLFIPAGGRPETIDRRNWEKFFANDGTPAARVIIEGANSFITPEARLELQKRGVAIMRDASANKCGVISSSYEIIANLLMNDQEFLAHKARYVTDVIQILNHLAEQEARLILMRHQLHGGAVPYTQISNNLSREINDHYARMFDYFQSNPELADKPVYRNAMLYHLPNLIHEDKALRERVWHMPRKIQFAILASMVASKLVYTGDDSQAFADMVEAQLQRLPKL
ncbi:MAG: NAD-glutamate dehydrogenase [Thiothrix sp.]|nr:NAD-glutamate dehydrogenase [Thiothrix sp.]HPQ94545.1 NAD-glutamate dehydrogenase [Thiolinea sp.]